MKLYYFTGENGVKNFGDELNNFVWPRLIPGIFANHDDTTQFVGIGTVLNDQLPVAPRTIVFGSGVGYYGKPRRDASWDIYCVRGPLSAQALELPASAAVTDPGILAPQVFEAAPAPGPSWKYAFMPHWQTTPSDWERVCDSVKIGFIDPRWEPGRVIAAMRRSQVLLTEAMHGAIVADALRIPWVAIRTHSMIRSRKWEDWCQSMELAYSPVSVPTIWPARPDASLVRQGRRWARLRVIGLMLHRAGRTSRPVLSRSDVFAARLAEIYERLGQFCRREGFALRALSTSVPPPPSATTTV